MKTLKKITAFLLCISVVLCLCSCGKKEETVPEKKEPAEQQDTVRYTEEALNITKTETVYISMDNSGKVTGTTVTDWLHTDKDKVRVTDVSDLSDIKNVKTGQLPATENENLVWNMDSTDVYYSGTTDKKAPVSFDISYYLDGKKMTAEEIAGKSGHVEIKIKTENHCFKDVEVNGKKRKVYLPVIAAGGTILQESEFSAIKVESGLSIGDGTKQITAAAGAPGLCESLGIKQDELNDLIGVELSDTFVISADTTCFETTDFYFAVIPFCSLDVDLIAPDSVSGLMGSLKEIKKIFNSLENIDISSIIGLISGGSGSTDELIGAVNSALKLYDENEAVLKLGSKYFTDENMKTLSSAAELFGDEDFVKGLTILGKSDIGSVAASLPEVAESLEGLAPIIKSEAFASGIKLLSSPVMVKFFEQLPELSKSLSAIQNLVGNDEFLNAINTLSNPAVGAVFEKMPDLMKNFEALEPLLGDLQKDLNNPEIQKSINNLPETMKSISRLIELAEKNSGIINKLINLAEDENIQKFIEILRSSDIDTAAIEKKLKSLVNNADKVAANAEKWIDFGKSYGVFTDNTDKQATVVLFVYNTPAIEKVSEAKAPEVKEKEHWYTRIINLFKREE